MDLGLGPFLPSVQLATVDSSGVLVLIPELVPEYLKQMNHLTFLLFHSVETKYAFTIDLSLVFCQMVILVRSNLRMLAIQWSVYSP